jgi:hypothetical protein
LRWAISWPLRRDAVADVARQRHEQLVRVERRRRFEADRAVEPAEQRLALGVGVVVQLHRGTALREGLVDRVEPRVETGALLGGAGDDAGARERFPERGDEAVAELGRDRVDLVDDDDVRFLELLAVHVDDLLGEVRPLLEPEDAGRARRVDQDAHRGDLEPFAVDSAERIRNPWR